MDLTLPKGLEDFVQEQLDLGLYESAGEVCRDGLRLLKASKEGDTLRLARLRQDLALGVGQLDRGEGTAFDPREIVAFARRKHGR